MAQNSSSPMSITQLVHSDINDIEDPDVKIAAEVLGDMARLSCINKKAITLPPLSTPSTTPSSPLPTPTTSSFSVEQRLSFSSESTMDEDQHLRHQQQQNFIHRVSNIPLVNSALKAYESSKNSNSVVKYGAEMVESFAAPIYDKFGKHALSGVDEWGCKQLDKLEERYPKYVVSNNQADGDEDDDDAKSATFALSRATLMDDEGIRKRRDSRDETSKVHKSKSRNPSRSTSPHRPSPTSHGITKPLPNRQRQQPLVRSKWHQIVMHASTAAGTTAAVISEESMKCLKYCLNWLQYASQHIDQQMNLLREFLVSLASKSNQITHDENTTKVSNIKKEIVDTLRKVVQVVSKYAGSGLPEQAKASVRGFILALPTRWAILNSTTNSPTASPSMGPVTAHETSMKLLNFGSESVEMINSVAHVFSDTIERAELWLNRLRVVGVAGNRRNLQPSESEPEQMDLN
ncbi:transcription factor Opi1-domain-containing protein [Parasitella parasitica]|nr:transcription factor Opi1-domain-containing protein [Parasitella parasitica]